jgi:hypothetical protein
LAKKPTKQSEYSPPAPAAAPAAPAKGVFDFDALKARRNAAAGERATFQPLLDEAFKYAIPFRKSKGANAAGEKRVNQVFDHTAIDAAFRFAGKMQQDLWPAGSENFQLEPGPVVRDQAQRDQLSAYLANTTAICQAFFDDGAFDMALHEVALDLSAGNGCMLMNPSDPDEPEKLWDPISVSIDEVLWEMGPNNTTSGIFWERRMSHRVLFATWPEGQYSARLQKALKDKPEGEVVINLDTVWDRKKKRWCQYVSCKKDDGLIFTRESRTCPWATPRYFRVPGETYGRGPVMLAMPSIKTLNTAKRLQLQAAAIAMLGIYTAVDDGVFNPDVSSLEPGTFWKVARNGGPMGPSISRFPDPRLDLSGLVVENMQMDVKATMMDQALPVEGAAVKSATEILERVKRLAQDHIGAYGRLVRELVVPVVRRVLELAYERQLIDQQIPLDQLLVKVKVKSPLAIARETTRVTRIIEWLQMVLAICEGTGNPAMAHYVAKIEEALRLIGREYGVPNDLILTTDEADKVKKADQAHQLALAAAQAGAGASMPAAAS